MKVKALLYCTKAKPYLVERLPFNEKKFYQCRKKNDYYSLNGKIVAECDYEVEEIFQEFENETDRTGLFWYRTNNLIEKELLERSGLTITELNEYLEPLEQKYVYGKGWQIKPNGYAIHIKNLHIFDEPKELSDYYTRITDKDRANEFEGIDVIFPSIRICKFLSECVSCKRLEKAPQNMQKIVFLNKKTNEYEYAVLISIQPQWLCKILNGEKTIEVRKKVLKEMIIND